jgi:O-antigen/teichoic acid export membrane protein
MGLRRIAKAASALMSGQGVNIITQLLLPPIFISHYGIPAYGEWLTLTATVSYLSTLNFGLQTFANNQVAIYYNRGEIERAHTIQSSALLLLLAIISSAAVVTAAVFFLPINVWLGLKTDAFTVSATVYLLGLQILTRMLLGFIAGIYLVVGVSYRGTNWVNIQALVTVVGTAVLALKHVSFTWIAAQQVVTLALFCVCILIDLRVTAPVIFPRMRYAKLNRFREILKPSGYFGLLFSSNILVYQLPVIIMQRLLGPSSVVVFSLTRTIFSMSRQALTSISQALGGEITEYYGQGAWTRLYRLYELSERVIFALVPPITIGTLLATPVLMTIWLHKPGLYNPYVCLMMALISGATGIKEHKYQFQTCSNEHTKLARLMFWSYVVMVALAVPGIHFFGSMGFLVPWFITEAFQVTFILRLNQRLFVNVAPLDFAPVYKLFALIGGAVMLAAWFAVHAAEKPLLQTATTTLIFMVVLGGISYRLFGLKEVRTYLRSRIAVAQGKPA